MFLLLSSSFGITSITFFFSPIPWNKASTGSVALLWFSNLYASSCVRLEVPNFVIPRSYLVVAMMVAGRGGSGSSIVLMVIVMMVVILMVIVMMVVVMVAVIMVMVVVMVIVVMVIRVVVVVMVILIM